MVTGKEQEAKHTTRRRISQDGGLFRGTVEPDVKQSGKAVILLPGLALEEMMS